MCIYIYIFIQHVYTDMYVYVYMNICIFIKALRAVRRARFWDYAVL